MPPPFHTGSRVVRRLLAWVFVLLIASGAAAAWWLHEPLATGAEPLELAIEPGTTPRGVARDVVKAPDVIDYSRHENVAERLVKRFGAAVGEGSVRALRASTGLR